MSTITEADLDKKYTEEECDAMFDAAMDASLAGNREEATRILRIMPLPPHWAKIIAKIYGKDYLRGHFNITQANDIYGEGWLDGE